MVTLQTALRPNEAEVAARVMEGEAILINISTGMYHSMDGAGGFVWGLIEKGHSLEQIVESLTSNFDVAADTATADVQALAETLLSENLVLTSDDAPPALDAASGDKQAYATPALNTYRDMSDLLALDPPMPGMQQMPNWDEGAA